MPRSEWKRSPGPGWRLASAPRSASPDSSASSRSPTDQPTTLRENRSRMTTRKMNPPSTGKYVVSATQARSGASAVKLRSSRLAAIGSRCVESVVRRQRRRGRARSPCLAIEAATRFLLVRCPRGGAPAGCAALRSGRPAPRRSPPPARRAVAPRAPAGTARGSSMRDARSGRARAPGTSAPRVVRLLRLDELEAHFPLLAKKAAAFRRKSRSIVTVFISRRKRVRSARSSLVSGPCGSRLRSMRLSHPSAHRRLRQVQFPRDLPDALAARAYQPDHLSLVLGGELPSLPVVPWTQSPSHWRCPRIRGRLTQAPAVEQAA